MELISATYSASIGILRGNKYFQNVHDLLSNIYSNVKQDSNTKSVIALDCVCK
jgi:hypothetical protein